MRFNPARGADKGAISQQTSPLPSGSLSHPPPIQDPVAPPKRVTVGRMAALRLRLRPCLTPASKKQIQPGSRCLQGGDLTSNLATAHCLSLFNPSPTQDPVNAPRQVVAGRTAALRLRLRPCPTLSGKNQLHPSSGCRQGGFNRGGRCIYNSKAGLQADRSRRGLEERPYHAQSSPTQLLCALDA
jgi:hypothetical protein